MKVFVVVEWTDFKSGGNEANVLGVYKDKDTAWDVAKISAKENVTWDLEELSNGYQITDGTDYMIYEIRESIIV